MEVCILDTTSCETTDADGWVTMTPPAKSKVTLTVIKEGYSPTLSPQLTTEDDVDDLRTAVLDEQTVTLLAGVLGTPYPLEGGVIAISAPTTSLRQEDNGIAGITFAIDQETPYYLDENGFPSFDIGATTEPDGAARTLRRQEDSLLLTSLQACPRYSPVGWPKTGCPVRELTSIAPAA